MKIINVTSNKTERTAQDYGGYYSGEAPEYQGSLIGSPSVDLSQLSSMFGDAQKSVDLVNQFDASLLKNIVYLFNFSKSGVYGVYVPALDREVKTQELRKRLEAMGYQIVEENGMMTAHPTKGEKDQATIQAEIKQVYDDLESKGGSVLGLNINDTRVEAEQSFNNLSQAVDPEMHNELKNDLMIAHLASTIAHEATHAHGHEDEAMPEQVGESLLHYALNVIRQKFGIEGELNIQHGASDNWYKTASYDSYTPLYGPTGSDLTGRHGRWDGRHEGTADFGMMAQQFQNAPIEQMLGRQFMFPLPPDISQEHNSIEEQLRKYTKDDFHLDPKMIFTELLSEGHVNDDTGYRTIEELLEDNRPQPLMKPLKTASMIKEATLFGWYNNLEISDGSTIPGMGDRVMAWDDRDESFADEETWIKSQPRYNPEYDVKGFYYRWIEPRFQPELWDSYTRDYSNTHPAKRFASEDDLACVVKTLEKVRNNLLSKDIQSTRFIGSEDIGVIIDKVMTHSKINFDVFDLNNNVNGDDVFAYWVYTHDVDTKDVINVEKAIQKGLVPESMHTLIGCESTLGDSVEEIMETVKEVCYEYGIKGIYAIGAYAREKSFGCRFPEVSEIDFSGDNPTKNLKVGYILAKKLGVENVRVSKTSKSVNLVYKGIKVSFSGGGKPDEIVRLMNSKGIDSSSAILADACNKDFTINMKAYNPVDGFVYPLLGDDNQILRTLFDADDVIAMNPFIMLRAMHLILSHGCQADPDLESSIRKNGILLFDGSVPDDQLSFAKKQILDIDPEKAKEVLNQFGLGKFLEIGD